MSEHSTTEEDRPCGSVVNCPFKGSDSNQHRRHLCLQFYMQFSTFEKIKAEEMNKALRWSVCWCRLIAAVPMVQRSADFSSS